MTTLPRRAFVRAGGLAMASLGLEALFLTRPACAVGPPPGPRGKALVCLFLRGGVDGLSMVVPHGDAHYYRARPRIAIAPPGHPGGVIDLDGHFGLHPALAPLEPIYRMGSLAVVHAVGSPVATYSHFDAQHDMETGTPGMKRTSDGWVNRYLQHMRPRRATPCRAVALGPRLPCALQGSAPMLAIGDLRQFGLEAFEAPRHSTDYPASQLGASLHQVAQVIKRDLGFEIAVADVGGWDTHVNQGAATGQLALRLADLGRALAAFATDLGERMTDVVLFTMSEFGRTVAENDHIGTDHGRGTAMLVMGGTTRGGRVLGRWPTLDPAARFQGRDLAVTTDFRDLISEVLTGHFGAGDMSCVFPGFTRGEPVGVIPPATL